MKQARIHAPIRGRWAAYLLLLSICGLSTPTAANGLQLDPVLAEVPSGNASSVFRLRNPNRTPLTVQVEARQWYQAGGNDRYATAKDLIVVPPLVTIPPGGDQVIRVARTSRGTAGEVAYRIAFREVPPEPAAGFVGVQTALRLDVPLFFLPDAPRDQLVWRAERRGGNLHLTAENRGNHYTRFAQLRVLDANGRVLAETRSLTYVLAGATRYWTLPAKDLPRGQRLRLVIGSGSGQQELPLTLD